MCIRPSKGVQRTYDDDDDADDDDDDDDYYYYYYYSNCRTSFLFPQAI